VKAGQTAAMTLTSSRIVAACSAIAALAALAVAFGSEDFLGLVPCALCLWERWPYRIAIGLGVLAVLLPRPGRIALLWLLVLAMLAAAALAFVHVGVEQGYWPSPLPECAAPHFTGGSIAERLASMPAKPSKPCDDPTFLVPGLPVSMAAMNLLFALAFAALLAIYLVRSMGRRI
jgi:disulfide bond formation protein DsbB